MFRISRRLDYGLQLMVTLAASPDNRAQATATLAEKLQIPLPFLHQIGHTLMQAGMLKASPGPHGGVRLSRPAEEITALQIVETLEGPVSLNPCTDCNGDCPRKSQCIVQFMWREMQDKVISHLATISLSSLVADESKLELFALKDNNVESVLSEN
jgi:Rrf2 family protein